MNKKIFVLFGILMIFFLTGQVKGEDCFSEYECGEWSICNDDGIQQRTCSDISCGKGDIIERKFCLKPGCKPDIQCSNWGICNYNKKLNDIINRELVFEGYTERFCRDLNGCIESSVEIMPCDLSVPIKTKKVITCNEEYIEIFDEKTEKLIGRIKEKTDISSGRKRVDISFLTGESSYCGYCYDNEKNYDETGIDCGGPSCPSCVEIKEFFDWAYWMNFFLWMVFGILLVLFLIQRKNEKKSDIPLLKQLSFWFKVNPKEREKILEEKIKMIFYGNRFLGNF